MAAPAPASPGQRARSRGELPRVLSVQSHVVHGYVGNRSAVFPLQLLGFEVDVINSVQFSCHTGYPAICGQKLTGSDLRDLADGLAKNEVLDHDYLLTGYIGTASFLQEVVRLLDRMPAGCRYVCDPVLGDNGKMYTTPDLVDVYREQVLPRVAMLTPNQFEAELLTQSPIRNVGEAVAACNKLHELGVGVVCITTLDVPDANCDGSCCAMMFSEPGRDKWLLQMPFISGGPFTGTGDLMTAMLLAWTDAHPHEAASALEKAGAVLRATIQETVRANTGRVISGKTVPPELRILHCKAAIEHPPVFARCRLAVPLPNPLRGVLVSNSALDVKVGTALDDVALPLEARERLRQLAAAGVRVALAAGTEPRSAVELLDGRLARLNGDDGPAAQRPAAVPEVLCCRAWVIEPAELVVVSGDADELARAAAGGAVTVALLPESGGDAERIAKAARFALSSLDSLVRLFPS